MMKRSLDFFRRFDTPLIVIEYLVCLDVLASMIISLFKLADQDNNVVPATSIGVLIDNYEVVSIFFIIMAVVAVVNMVAVSLHDSVKSLGVRSVSLFTLCVGFFFVSILAASTFTPEGLLWINELVISMICGTLYLNIKVNHRDADR
jgi:hypothetical protein